MDGWVIISLFSFIWCQRACWAIEIVPFVTDAQLMQSEVTLESRKKTHTHTTTHISSCKMRWWKHFCDDGAVAGSTWLMIEPELALARRSASLIVFGGENKQKKLCWQYVLLGVMKLLNILRGPRIKRTLNSCIATPGAESPLSGSAALQAKIKSPPLWVEEGLGGDSGGEGVKMPCLALFFWQWFLLLELTSRSLTPERGAVCLYRPVTVRWLISIGEASRLAAERAEVALNTRWEALSSFPPGCQRSNLYLRTNALVCAVSRLSKVLGKTLGTNATH